MRKRTHRHTHTADSSLEMFRRIADLTKQREEAEEELIEFLPILTLTLRDAGQHHAADRLEYLLATRASTAQLWDDARAKHPIEFKAYLDAWAKDA